MFEGNEVMHSIFDKFSKLQSISKEMQTEYRLSVKRQEFHNECKQFYLRLPVVAQNQQFSKAMTIVETVIFVLLVSFQIYYIKRVLDHKMII